MSSKLGVVIVGYGFMGTTHLSAWKMIPEAEVKAIVGRNIGRAQEVARKHGVKAYSDLSEALEREEVDVVDVCTPTHTHAEISLKAIREGKHVLVEKPMALSLKDADAMIEAARSKGVKLMVAHVLRFFPDYAKAKELVDQGVIGELVASRAFRGVPFPDWAEWFKDKDKSGGVTLDLAIHDVDYLMWCFGSKVDRVYAKVDRLVRREATAEDFALITLRFKGGEVALVEASWAVPRKLPLTTALDLIGTKGMITLDNQSTIPVKLITSEAVETFSPGTLMWRHATHPFPIDPYYREIKHFVECILTDKEPVTSGEVSRKSLEVCLAALESAEQNRPVKLPLR